MVPGYNTNGFAHHRLDDALDVIGEMGYGSVALTLDHCHLDPFAPDLSGRCAAVRAHLRRLGLRCVIETGARFLLNRWRKHQPTLLDPDPRRREQRFDFLLRSIDIAAQLGADAVSFWSGAPSAPEEEDTLLDRLVQECRTLCEQAEAMNVRLAFEPEPGMFIATMARYERLFDAIAHPRFGLTLDVGHLHCLGEVPIAPYIDRWKDVLWNVHIEDMRRGTHDHLMFGEGEIDFPPVLDALRRAGYDGGVHVELSRHSHNAVETARASLDFLRKAGLS